MDIDLDLSLVLLAKLKKLASAQNVEVLEYIENFFAYWVSTPNLPQASS